MLEGALRRRLRMLCIAHIRGENLLVVLEDVPAIANSGQRKEEEK
jgi:hypothetical protein